MLLRLLAPLASRFPKDPGTPQASPWALRLRPLWTVACLVGLAFCLPACQSNQEDGELSDEESLSLYYERALRYYEMRELDRCQDQVQRGLEIDPKNERLLLMLGRCHQTRGTLQDVLAAEKIFRTHPAKKDFRVRNCLGGSLERKGSYYYEAAIAVASGERLTEAADPEARAEELKTQAFDSWREAYSEYEEALRLFPGGFEALNGLMRTSVLMEQYDQSFEWSTHFLKAISESNQVFRKRLREQQTVGDATVDTELTLLNNSDLEVQVRLHRSELLHRRGEFRDSLSELDTALAIDDQLPDIYALRGQLLRKLGEYQRSNDSLQEYLSLSNDPFDHPNVRQAFDWIEANKADLAVEKARASQR